MMEFLTCRKIGFMFGCFGLILAHLGRFWAGIAECGDHVGLWLSSWCFDGVSVMSIALVVCVRFHGIVGCGCVVSWFVGLYWWYVTVDLVVSWWSVVDVLGQFLWCLLRRCNVSKLLLCDRCNTLASFSEDELCEANRGFQTHPDATLKAPEVLQVKKVQRALFTSATPRRYWRKVPPLIPMLWGKVAAETSGTLK
jgi:hypothetical protein